jgi:hypothetical protein
MIFGDLRLELDSNGRFKHPLQWNLEFYKKQQEWKTASAGWPMRRPKNLIRCYVLRYVGQTYLKKIRW